MLGRMPFVSISDNRLGGMENSSLRYRSATRALEFSTSRMVRPSFSRRVRRLLPAGSMKSPSNGERHNTKHRKAFVCFSVKKIEWDLVTKTEQTETRLN